MKKSTIIAITGGIGSGKSVVSQVLRVAGFAVYDCDDSAKWLMNHSPIIKQNLIDKFGKSVYNPDGSLNRTALSAIIFNNKDSLLYVNSLVHPAVRNDIMQWLDEQSGNCKFIETAILKEGGLDEMVDKVWNVVAPLEVRIERVMRRNNASREQVLERIANQNTSFQSETKPVTEIINDNITALLPQIIQAANTSSI